MGSPFGIQFERCSCPGCQALSHPTRSVARLLDGALPPKEIGHFLEVYEHKPHGGGLVFLVRRRCCWHSVVVLLCRAARSGHHLPLQRPVDERLHGHQQAFAKRNQSCRDGWDTGFEARNLESHQQREPRRGHEHHQQALLGSLPRLRGCQPGNQQLGWLHVRRVDGRLGPRYPRAFLPGNRHIGQDDGRVQRWEPLHARYRRLFTHRRQHRECVPRVLWLGGRVEPAYAALHLPSVRF
mmetsp:Transcript_24775/g.62078  ORF Transcript_24775/g.62078 Transcript_24775/m.62078 type:complete len:239 (-) Transcript_24775:2506-3222(-)